MATTLHFDFRATARRNSRNDRWFATSEQIPLYVVAESLEQLEERIAQTMNVFLQYIEEKYSFQELEEYLLSRGIDIQKSSSLGVSEGPRISGKAQLVMAGNS